MENEEAFVEKINEAIDDFKVDMDRLKLMAAAFRFDMNPLKQDYLTSLEHFKSYANLPTGQEKGEFIAVDLGGTNLRVYLIELLGEGEYEILPKIAEPLKVDGKYDYTHGSAEDFFDFIADRIGMVAAAEKEYRLGLTFSFPVEMKSLDSAILQRWTKEFNVEGVVGKDVMELLREALHRKGLDRVKPTAVLNDTTSALLAAAYEQTHTYIGAIYATGFNIAAYDKAASEAPMIINLEAGGFSKLTPNHWDMMLDKASVSPGAQRMEKMVSGRYMGELYSLVAASLMGKEKPYNVDSRQLTEIMETPKESLCVLFEKLMGISVSEEEAAALKKLAVAIAKRSARLAGAALAGAFWHIDSFLHEEKQYIAIDGSVYNKMPGIREEVTRALYEILGEDAARVEAVPVGPGTILGAAIAAGMH